MKMNLKNRNLRGIKIKAMRLTSRNLFIFLFSFSVVTLIIGIIFYFFLNTNDKALATSNINDYFTIGENYSYFNLFKDSIINNTFNIFLIWILGLSVIGVIANIFIYFFQMFSIGFTLASIFGNYGFKGIVGSFCYLFPSKICYVMMLFLLTFFSIKISYKVIRLCFTSTDINIKEEMRKYFKVLLFAFIFVLVIAILEVFIDPIFIKIFTKI